MIFRSKDKKKGPKCHTCDHMPPAHEDRSPRPPEPTVTELVGAGNNYFNYQDFILQMDILGC